MRVGVDIGGTFTDFCLVEHDGKVTNWKEATTPHDYTEAIEKGLRALAEQRDVAVEALLSDAEVFVHGTTIATNAVIQGRGAKVAVLCTAGFRDVLYFRDNFKPDRFDIHRPHPEPLVRRHLRLGIPERVGADGAVVSPLNESSVREAVATIKQHDVAAVAVAFMWSVANASHERRAAQILADELPGIPILCSSDILPQVGEWERASATVLSAFILPLIQEYVSGLDSKLDELGLRRQLQLMQVNGGCASPEEIVRRPVYLLHSGPAAAPAAAGVYSKTLNVPNALVIDMGGTSLDICVAQDGRPRVSTSIRAGEHPIGVAGAEVLSIGAGGGSIGWLDSGGALRVGPRSAGAVPGPAAYGAGGTEPTVTDANVIAGYLSPDAFLGGRRRLDVAGARQAIATHVADPLGMSVEDAAAGILKVVNTNMVGAIRSVSVNRGVDPRTFTMIVGGGAGALHAVQMARALGMSRVVVPPQAGVLCSFGMTVTDVQHDYVAPYHGLTRSVDTEALAAVVGRLRDKARARLLEEGFDENSIRIEYGVDARYPGQIHDLPVALGPDIRFDADGIAEIERRFHQDHEREFAYSRPDVEVEFFHWRVKGIGLSGADTAFVLDDAVENLEEPQLRGTRDAYFEEAGGFVKTNIIDGSTLKPGMSFAGPAVIELPTTTIVVGPHDRSEILTDGTVSITVGAVARTGALPQV